MLGVKADITPSAPFHVSKTQDPPLQKPRDSVFRKSLTPNSKADGIHCSGCSSQTLDLCSLSVFSYLTLRLSLGFFFSEKPQLSGHLSLAKGISEYSQRNLCVTPLRDVQSLDHVGTVIQAFCVS